MFNTLLGKANRFFTRKRDFEKHHCLLKEMETLQRELNGRIASSSKKTKILDVGGWDLYKVFDYRKS